MGGLSLGGRWGFADLSFVVAGYIKEATVELASTDFPGSLTERTSYLEDRYNASMNTSSNS
jgi:hypothetical protein